MTQERFVIVILIVRSDLQVVQAAKFVWNEKVIPLKTSLKSFLSS